MWGKVKLETNFDEFSIISQDCIANTIQLSEKRTNSSKNKSSNVPKQSGLIKPQIASSHKKEANSKTTSSGVLSVNTDDSHYLSKNTLSAEKHYVGRVSISDCLSCSGCATTSELIFKQHQSIDQFLSKIKEKPFSVISISPQSRAALAHYFDMSDELVMRKLSGFFKFIGFDYVFDMSLSEAIVILESQQELLATYNDLKSHKLKSPENIIKPEFSKTENITPSSPGKLPLISSHCPSLVLYAQKHLDASSVVHMSKIRSSQQVQGIIVKSLLRRVENDIRCKKFHGLTEFPFPFDPVFLNKHKKVFQKIFLHHLHQNQLSKIKLVYQMTKNSIQDKNPSQSHHLNSASTSENSGDPFSDSTLDDESSSLRPKDAFRYLKPDDIFHVCIMPCYDKKVEAARPELNLKGEAHNSSADVNIVLSTTEVLELLDIYCTNLKDIPERKVDSIINPSTCSIFGSPDTQDDDSTSNNSLTNQKPYRVSPSNGANGGYVDSLFRFCAKAFYGVEVEGPLQFNSTEDPDFKEVNLTIDGKIVLRFAISYGLKNITKIMKGLSHNHSSNKNTSYQNNLSLTRNILDYDYIELLQCTGGCLNGNGQPGISQEALIKNSELTDMLPSSKNPRKKRSFLENLEKAFHSNLNTLWIQPEDYPHIYNIYNYLNTSFTKISPQSVPKALSPWLSVDYPSLKEISNFDLMNTHLTNMQW